MFTVLEALNQALHHALATDPDVIILGEDLLDPYGGAFKVTRGLSTHFPERVLTTPISEAAISGVASGLALRGFRPVVEIMFGDFITLIADQLINHITKFRWMYNDQVRVPLVIRTPMGGRRGYGPTHSQSLEKHLLGIPGLHIVAPCDLGDPGKLLANAILDDDDPVLFIENKLLYPTIIQNEQDLLDFTLTIFQSTVEVVPYAPTYILSIRSAPPPHITLATYGYMARLAREAILLLAYEYEIFCELIIPTLLSPLDSLPVIESVRRTRKLLTIEEGTHTHGWGAEVIAITNEHIGNYSFRAGRIAAKDSPIPASGPLEKGVLPQIETIVQAVKSMV